MRAYPCFFVAALTAAVLCNAIGAESLLPPEPVRLDTLAAFRAPGANWQLAGGIAGDPRHEKTLQRADGTGVIVNTPVEGARTHLLTLWEHGDLDLDLDFLLPPGSNSGIYLQGRYEVQLFDSWGVREPTAADCGAIYERWDDARGKGKEGYEGHAPRANASRAPGLWQHLHIEFQAPRFDGAGKKTKNARFAKVVLNGFVVQENVDVTGPTRSSSFDDEKSLGPLMIQGDHGPVAIRAIFGKRFDPDAHLGVENISYQLYSGSYSKIGEYDGKSPATGKADRLSQASVEKSGKFALVFDGLFAVARAGDYVFAADGSGPVRLQIEGQTAVVSADRGGVPGKVTLTAGTHPFHLDYLHNGNGRPALDVTAEGPGFAPYSLSGRENRPVFNGAARVKPILIEPKDRVLAQRSFVPYEPRKRLYAINVGTPAGVHFSYDFETCSLLRVWRGGFLDAAEMWEGRGEPQLAKPTGPALTLNDKPNVALIETPQTGGWPDQPEALASSQGYSIEPDGTPTFLARLADVTIRDRLAPAADGRSLTRTMTFSGNLPSWSVWVLLAEADTIAPQPDGHGWIVGDRAWYVDWPDGSPHHPVIRTSGGRRQLAVRLAKDNLDAPVVYTLVW